jgi:hypothetical protein
MNSFRSADTVSAVAVSVVIAITVMMVVTRFIHGVGRIADSGLGR